MVGKSLLAAEALAPLAVDAEVVHLRTLYPRDRDTVYASLRKTGRVLVVNEAVKVSGWSGEIIAERAENLFDALKARPVGSARRARRCRSPRPWKRHCASRPTPSCRLP